ncbi:chorismate-binding protein [Blastococcus montanus]|uniref:chorismate-binding protein n=1 Tax=Blastococcus montanus TaxID=3144973 RepID=UPI0032086B3D
MATWSDQPVTARFDDLVAGTALSFGQAHRVLTAERPEDVVPLLADVERATARGRWAFGYLAYEAAPGLDPRRPVADRPPADLPLAVFALCDRPDEVAPVASPRGRDRAYRVGPWTQDWTGSGHRAAVERVRSQIAAGRTYQLNLTVRMDAPAAGPLDERYADLAWAQQGSYAAHLELGRFAVVSASPELFFEWRGDRLITRPMKGTAARGPTTAADADRRSRLLGSEKERAENLMIVDLLRNDLGRLAAVGSVEVPALFRAERYGTVWQLTSDVTARPRAGTGLVDVFRALFPSGSVTGAPKQRSMELIRELEPRPRGVYCGAIGVVAPPGHPYRARFNVAIRTVTVDRVAGTAEYGTGGGITWSSDPAAEHAELLAKAAILAEPHEEFALLETMAHVPGEGLRNLGRHLDRLTDSAAYFGFPVDRQAVAGRLAAAVDGYGAARVRLALHRDGALDIDLRPLPGPAQGPVRLVVDPEPVAAGLVWLHHKTTRRRLYTERAARHPEADDVLLVNEAGEVTESTIATVAARLDGTWWTPPLSAGCLPGVERARLVAAGQLRERALTPDDLRRADALALVSSLRGRRPAVLL